MQPRYDNDVEPATDAELAMVAHACREYLADIARDGVGPDNLNLYQEDLLQFMGERMPAVLARLNRTRPT